MVRSYPDMSVRVIQYAPYRITFCLYFRMELDLVPFRFYVFLKGDKTKCDKLSYSA